MGHSIDVLGGFCGVFIEIFLDLVRSVILHRNLAGWLAL